MLHLSFMLQDEDETEVGSATCPVVPRVGDIVWLQRKSDVAREAGKPQMESYRVESVAYWMNNLDGGFTMDSARVAVFVSPVT